MNIVILIANEVDPKGIKDLLTELLMKFESDSQLSWAPNAEGPETFSVTLANKTSFKIYIVHTLTQTNRLLEMQLSANEILCLGAITDPLSHGLEKLKQSSPEAHIKTIHDGVTLYKDRTQYFETELQRWLRPDSSISSSNPRFFTESSPRAFEEAPEQAALRAAMMGYMTRQRYRLYEVELDKPYRCEPKKIIEWAKCELMQTLLTQFHDLLLEQVRANAPEVGDLSPLMLALEELKATRQSLIQKSQRLIPAGLITSYPGSDRNAMEASHLLFMKIALLEEAMCVLYQPQAVIPLDVAMLQRCHEAVGHRIQRSTLHQIAKTLNAELALLGAYREKQCMTLVKNMKPYFETYSHVIAEAPIVQTLALPPKKSEQQELHQTWLASLCQKASAMKQVPLMFEDVGQPGRLQPFTPLEMLQQILNPEDSVFAILHKKRDKHSHGETKLIKGFRYLNEMKGSELPADYWPILSPALVVKTAKNMNDKAQREKYLALHHLSLRQHPQYEVALRNEALSVFKQQFSRYFSMNGRDETERALIEAKKTAIASAERLVESASPHFSIQALIHQMLTELDPVYGCLHESRHQDDHRRPAIIVALLKLKAICDKPGRIMVTDAGDIVITPLPVSLTAKIGGMFGLAESRTGQIEYFDELCGNEFDL